MHYLCKRTRKMFFFFILIGVIVGLPQAATLGNATAFFLPKNGLKTRKMRAKYRKTHFFCIFFAKNLVVSKICCTFAPQTKKNNQLKHQNIMKTFAQFKKEVSKKANFEFFSRLGMDIDASVEKGVTYYAIVCQKNRDEWENKNLYTLYVYYCLTSEWIESKDLYFDDAHKEMTHYCDFE